MTGTPEEMQGMEPDYTHIVTKVEDEVKACTVCGNNDPVRIIASRGVKDTVYACGRFQRMVYRYPEDGAKHERKR